MQGSFSGNPLSMLAPHVPSTQHTSDPQRNVDVFLSWGAVAPRGITWNPLGVHLGPFATLWGHLGPKLPRNSRKFDLSWSIECSASSDVFNI